MVTTLQEMMGKPIGCEQSHVACPLCGEQMKKTRTTGDSGMGFVWYECKRDNCSGWLVHTVNLLPVRPTECQMSETR